MDAREQRLARNEEMFREVNEQVGGIAGAHGGGSHVYRFVCECSNPDCTLQLSMTLAEYEAVRAHGARFAVATGHALPDIEVVVDARDGYDVIEKQGEAGAEAQATDPRG